MKILVTGGAGFIGGRLASRLISIGNNVVVIDDLSSGSMANVPFGAEFIRANLSDPTSFGLLPHDIQVVFHLAGQVSGERSMSDPMNDLQRNSLATLQLMRWAKEAELSRFVFASSMGVYEDSLGRPAREVDSTLPKSHYGLHKLACERYLSSDSQLGPLTTTLRLFNVYGPGQDLTDLTQGMVSIYLAQMLSGGPVLVKGPLNRIRDFVYIDDVVDAFVATLDEASSGMVFNVATSHPTTVGGLIQKLTTALQKEEEMSISVIQRTPADIDSCFGDNTRIRDVLGWRPKVALEDGIRQTVQSVLENS